MTSRKKGRITDKMRLDWLNRTKSECMSAGSLGFVIWPGYNCEKHVGRGIRKAIDAAMKSGGK